MKKYKMRIREQAWEEFEATHEDFGFSARYSEFNGALEGYTSGEIFIDAKSRVLEVRYRKLEEMRALPTEIARENFESTLAMLAHFGFIERLAAIR